MSFLWPRHFKLQAIGGLLGVGGGQNGTGTSGPSAANIVNPTNSNQISTAYTGNQAALQQQQALLNALQGQNGIGNQSQVYNQLQGVVNGTGPNPAVAALNQQTGANVAQTAALQAGQRGAASNVGLIARQAGQQGAATQQNAVGQAATLQANQSLNALNSAGNIANTQTANQIGATTANTQAQQNEQNQLLNAQQAYNNAQVGSQSSVNAGNTTLGNTTMQGQQGLLGGVLQGAGSALGLADGGDVSVAPVIQSNPAAPQSSFAQFLKGWKNNSSPQQATQQDQQQPQTSSQALQKGASSATQGLIGALKGEGSGGPMAMAGGAGDAGGIGEAAMMAANGGDVPALVSPGEVYLSPEAVQKVRAGADPMHVGEKIGGKPVVGGAINSYANDIIPKDLKAGGIMLPRSETKSKNPSKNGRAFVNDVIAQRKVRG